MTAFATLYEQPVRFSPLPFEAYLYIDPGYTGNLFFEQRYLDQAKQELEVLATAVPSDSRGLVGLLANDAHLKEAVSMLINIDTEDNTALGSGQRINPLATPEINTLPKFMTYYKDAVKFSSLPSELHILVDPANEGKEMYFERIFYNANGEELEIRSSPVIPSENGGKPICKIDDNPLECAAYVQCHITDTYRAYRGSCDGSPPVRVKIFDFTFDFTFE